jgi:hypothetical protein
MLFVKRADSGEVHGPFVRAEVRRRLKQGEIDESWLATQAPSGSSPDDLRSQAWLPVYSVLELVPPSSRRDPPVQTSVNKSDHRQSASVVLGSTPRVLGSEREQFLFRIRMSSPYRFLRVVNNVVFWLHCILISLAVMLCLFGLGWSESLGFWSFLFLLGLAVETVIVVMVIRSGAEMAIDVADCIAEQTRLATESRERPLPVTTPAPPSTPPTGS